MSNQNYVKEILNRLEEGTKAIYDRYEKLIQSSAVGYENDLQKVDKQYSAAANRAVARSKIDLKNTLEKMADSGYVRSGETVQVTIAANADKADALAALEAQRAGDKADLNANKRKSELELSAQAEQEAGAFRDEMLKAYQEQINADREYEAQRRQEAVENARAQQELQIKLQTAEQAKKEKSKGVVPDKSPYDYLQAIVKQNTTYNKKKGYKVIDRREILRAVSAIVKDKTVNYQYRYELYLYAKSLGYVD